jgi:glycosyltransferase involved in cell wall biosynthesis
MGIYAEDYPWDVRVEKILGGLASHGHNVSLVCRNLNRRDKKEQIGNILCLRVLSPGIGSLGQYVYSLPAFFNPIWKSAIRKGISDNQIDLVIVRDLPLAPLALNEAKHAGIPCIVDMAENHPEMWKQVGLNDRWKVRSFILKNPYLAKKMEFIVANSSAVIFVVVEEMRSHLLSLGANPDNVYVISNTPELENVDASLIPKRVTQNKKYLDFVYTGFITKRRGLDRVIESLSTLKNMTPLPRLQIIGNGDYIDELKEITQSFQCESQIRFHGWVDHRKLTSMIAKFDVGIIPHPKNGHTDNTIPNKIFDYMAAGKPVLVSNARPLERMVKKLNCGIVYVDGSIDSMANAIRAFSNWDCNFVMGLNGYNAVILHYNWQKDFKRVLQVVESL